MLLNFAVFSTFALLIQAPIAMLQYCSELLFFLLFWFKTYEMKNPAIKFIKSAIIWAAVFLFSFWLLSKLGIMNLPLLS